MFIEKPVCCSNRHHLWVSVKARRIYPFWLIRQRWEGELFRIKSHRKSETTNPERNGLLSSNSLQNRTIKWEKKKCILSFRGSIMDLGAVYITVWWCSLIFYVSRSSELCTLKYQQKQNLNCKNTALNEIQCATVFHLNSLQNSFCRIPVLRSVWCPT